MVENRKKKWTLKYNPVSKQGFSVLGCFREIFYLNGYRSWLKETSTTPEDFHATIVRISSEIEAITYTSLISLPLSLSVTVIHSRLLID
jgi:hypothetical protein